MDYNTIALLGGKGMLGTDINACFSSQGVNVVVYDLPEFDITDVGQVTEAVNHCDLVINCAAYTNVEKAESESKLAYKINAEAVGQLGQIAKVAGTPVVHISTDFVFDGQLDRPYTERDMPNPLSVYGASKLKGERLLSDSHCRHCMIRVQWTYGLAGTNFVKKIIDASAKHPEMRVIDDQVGSPTATAEVARVIWDVLDSPTGLVEGLFHLAARDYVSRYEMTRFVFEKLRINTPVEPCKTSEFKTAAQRPLNSCFDCAKLEGVLGYRLRPWQEPLIEFLETL